MPELYHLAYISRNRMSEDDGALRENIEQILTTARSRNADLGITGALLFSGGYFCQVIEGTLQALEELFESIQMDPRHGDVTVLHYEPIDSRGFYDWSMALAGIEDKQRWDMEGIRASKDELAMHDAGRAMVEVLADLVSRQEQMRSSP